MTLIKYRSTIHADKLTSTDRTILENLENNIHEIPTLTLSELAKKVYTSSTSLHRLVKKLGFGGFTEFKYRIENELKQKNTVEHSIEEASHYFSDVLEDIKITYKLNESKLNSIVKDISSHKDIYCFGTGWKQKQIVDNFANDLLYYGHSVKSLRNTDDLEIASKQFNKETLVIIVSLTGNLNRYEKTMIYMRDSNITTIGASIYSDNPLSNMAKHSLQFVDSTLDLENHHWSSIPLNFIFDQLSHAVSLYNQTQKIL